MSDITVTFSQEKLVALKTECDGTGGTGPSPQEQLMEIVEAFPDLPEVVKEILGRVADAHEHLEDMYNEEVMGEDA